MTGFRARLKRKGEDSSEGRRPSSPRVSQDIPSSPLSTKPSGRFTLFEEDTPWWLAERTVASAQVDLLVPQAQRRLDELGWEEVERNDLPRVIRRAVQEAASIVSSQIRIDLKDIQDAITEITSLLLGKGPLQPLYDDPAVTDIFLDAHNKVRCIRNGHALETPFRFRSPDEFNDYVQAMLNSAGKSLTEERPLIDCVLNDPWRTRVSAVHSSLLDKDESSVVIRIPRLHEVTFYDLLRTKTLPATVAAWLAEIVALGEANILVCGPAGAGKTTFTTALLSSVGSDERVCTIEDVPELFVPTAHLEKLVARVGDGEEVKDIGLDELLRTALRRSPHRIIVGEIRDKEGPLFLRALETGHLGSVATIHAPHGKEALWRLLDVVAAYEQAPTSSLIRRISRTVHLVLSLKRIEGKPCLQEISEVLSPEGDDFSIRKIVSFEGLVNGKRTWRLCTPTSIWMSRLQQQGMKLVSGPSFLPPEESSVETSK